MSHSFEEKSFTHLTYCNQCKQLLWGIRKQGCKCKECGFTCHHKCRDSAPKCTRSVPKRFLDDNTTTSSPAETYLRELSQKTGADQNTGSSSESSTTSDKVQESTLEHIRAIISSEKLQNIVYEAASDNKSPINAYLANQPALNPQITAKNFTRFVSRCGPVFAFRDQLLLLLSWENPVDTSISLFIYCALCLYPKLLFFVPQSLLIYFILTNSPKKTKTETPETSKKRNNKNSSRSSKPKEEKPTPPAPAPAPPSDPSVFSFTLATLFHPASDESPEYLRNLQNIQNTMGDFSNVYDWIISQTTHFNWTDEEKTSRILQFLVISTCLFAIIISFIPVRFIFLSIGLCVYAMNTRFAKHMMVELEPYLLQFGKRKAQALSEWYNDLEKKLEQQDNLEEISVYENQRWWPRRGYLHEMVNDERTLWSDFNGTVKMPLITEIPAPKGYVWRDKSEWILDTNGPWIDTSLGLEISVKPDEEGWIYSDDRWNIAVPQIEPVDLDDGDQHPENLTRRRRWTRKCEKT